MATNGMCYIYCNDSESVQTRNLKVIMNVTDILYMIYRWSKKFASLNKKKIECENVWG